jgi:hypothetical protein
MQAACRFSPMASAKPTLDNPKGCLEWERIKQLPKDPSLIVEAEGKVVKVISQRILSLPSGHEYRVVLMQRPLPEALKSPEEMLRRRGNADSNTDIRDRRSLSAPSDRSEQVASQQRERAGLARILSSRIARTREPKAVAGEIAAFLGVPLDIEAMIRQVDGSLYRNRIK